MDAQALAEKMRNSRATAVEDPHYQEQTSAAAEAKRQRELAAEQEADKVIAEVLTKLDNQGHKPGAELEVMNTDHNPLAATIVFNRLMAAARTNGGAPCWYPVRDTEVSMCDDRYGVIKLRYGRCPDEQ